MGKQASTMLQLVRDRAGETAQAKGEVFRRGLPLTSGAIPFCVAQETSLAWLTFFKWPWLIFFGIFANSEIDQKIDFTLKPRLGAFFWSFEISDAKSGSFWDPKWIPGDDFFVIFQKTVTSLIQH